MEKKRNVGGQAVIEGVMMRGYKGIATAVRKSDGNIVVDIKQRIPLNKRNKLLSLPIIRGFIALIDSLIVGMDTLNFSASFFEEEEENSKVYDKLDKISKGRADNIIMGGTMILSFMVAIVLFVIGPTLLAQGFKKIGLNNIALNFIEGIFRVLIFLLYIVAITKMDDIYRMFQYHGAEHKTIFCYEAGLDLTVDNVKKFERLHPRCGTNFMFLVVLVSIILFSFTGWGNIWERIAIRIVLLPVVSGVTFELIKWLGASNSKLSKAIAYPGLKLQLLTTKEPDSSQIEVAIASLKAAEGISEEKSIGELLEYSNNKLKDSSSSYILDGQLIMSKILNKDKLYIITNRDKKVTKEEEEQFRNLIEKRKKNMPIKYILGYTEFMGIELHVEEGVLIPRGDTEILVEEAINIIKAMDKGNIIKVCDLCCGSGAIGLSLGKSLRNIEVDLLDIENIPEKVTKENINNLDLNDRCKFIHSDLLEKVIEHKKTYDVITSNPPYIRDEDIENLMEDVKNYEPRVALSGGEDGLDFYRKIANQGKKALNTEGYLIFEIGYDQGDSVKAILQDNGYKDIRVLQDLAGKDRVVLGKYYC